MRRLLASLALLALCAACANAPAPQPSHPVFAALKGVEGVQGAAVGGDLTGNLPNPTVAKIGGVAVGTAATASAGTLPAQSGATPASAGAVGETVVMTIGTPSSAVTVSHATPAVVTWTGIGATLASNCVTVGTSKCVFPVYFTGLAGVGIANSTPYFIDPASITTNAFQVATSAANAIAGTDVATSNTDSGTGNIGAYVAAGGTPQSELAIYLPAGYWACNGQVYFAAAASNALTLVEGMISQTPNTVSGLIASINGFQDQSTFATSDSQGFPTGVAFEPLSSQTLIYLNGDVTWSGGTSSPTMHGGQQCWRIQ